MGKSPIDAEVNNQVFRKDWGPQVIAKKRELSAIQGSRLANDGNDYIAGQCLVRKVSDGLFYRWSAASGATIDSKCVLMESVSSEQFPVTGGAMARTVMSGFVYKASLTDYVAGSSLGSGAVEQTDAAGITVVKF